MCLLCLVNVYLSFSLQSNVISPKEIFPDSEVQVRATWNILSQNPLHLFYLKGYYLDNYLFPLLGCNLQESSNFVCLTHH